MKLLNFSMIFLMVSWLIACQANGQSAVSVQEFQKKLQENTSKAQRIDVRTPQEFASGHLEGFLNFNISDPSFQDKISKLDKNKPVFVYCAVGGRSAAATRQLSSLGFTKIYDMRGGISAWRAAGLQTVR